MKISKKLYVDKSIPYYKWLIWRLRKDKKVKQIYCICMVSTKGYFLEIINSNKLKKQDQDNLIIGIATTRENAIKLTARIFDEIYKPNPSLQQMKDYFNT